MIRYDNHTHTHKSNILNRDSINFETDLIDKALELNLKGISITDHGNLCSHVDAIRYLKKLKTETEDQELKEKLNEFVLGLGTEIYLVDREEIEIARNENISTKFYHLVVVAKNYKGYRAIAELSSKAWEEAFYFRGVQRIPTYKDYFCEWAKRNKGNILISSACLGSEFSKLVLEFAQDSSEENRKNVNTFCYTMLELFGDDFYIEIQPSHFDEQIVYNKLALQIAKAFGIKAIITTDAHYLSLDKKEVHSIYLKSQDAERETEAFYSSTYLMDCSELKSYFSYIGNEEFEDLMNNSIELANKIENYDLYRDIEVPKTSLELSKHWDSVFKEFDLSNYDYIKKYLNSDHLIDKILLQEIEKGLSNKNININVEVLMRINTELESLWEISESLGQRMASYYLLTKEIVDIMWKVSLVGVGRGSAGAFYICYLLDITNINPIQSAFNLPAWRHIDKSKVELADIDIDTESGQRANILELVKDKFGHNKVLNIATFKTEGTSSAIQTMCRGMDISIEESSYLSSLAPKGITVKKALKEYENDKECEKFIKELMKYEGLIENIIEIEGLCCGKSVHASGIYIMEEEYWKTNAMMRAPKGQPITQYDMSCSDYQGGLKIDMLTVEALDRVRKDLDLMIEDGLIKWKGSLKDTYNSYLHPDLLDLKDPVMWEMLREHKILDAFQYDSTQGKNAIEIIQPNNFQELMDGNALMRLTCDGEQPINRYRKFKDNISLWYEEMFKNGLNTQEVDIMKEHLLKNYGVAATQESVMRLSMDGRIAGFNLVWANKLRKAIAKAKAKDMLEIVYNEFINNGIKLGNRSIFLEYIWESCMKPMYNYSFSEPHLAAYSMILIQEMNLARRSLLHWNVACLAINAGDINDSTTKATDYGAIAKAIGNMDKGFVTPPFINSAKVGFNPNMKNNTCTYGLGAINGISNEVARAIISLRPFSNLEDFLNRCIDTGIIKNSQMYNLVKAGCFDELEENRVTAMAKFVAHIVPNKEKLTTANIPKLISYGAIPNEYQLNVLNAEFKKLVFSKNNLVLSYNATQGLYKIPGQAIDYFNKSLYKEFSEAVEYDDDGELCLRSKEFNKIFKKVQAPLELWLKGDEALKIFNYCCKNEVWMKYCSGTISKWEMESICYYTGEHELDSLELSKYYNINSFKEMPLTPQNYECVNQRTGRKYNKYKLYLIAGTVVEKNRMKNMITLNTQYGVVDIKLSKDDFTHFNRKTTDDKSWFERGTKLIVAGFRRGETFIPKAYIDSVYQNNIMKIDIDDCGKVNILRERDI